LGLACEFLHVTVYVAVSRNPRDGDARGSLVAISGTTQQVKWKYSVEASIESTPVIGDDGNLYFGDSGGTIHAVGSRGHTAWWACFDTPVRSPGAVIAPGLVAFCLDDGSLVALKCSSQGLSTGGWPIYLGNRNQAGRVAVG